VLRRRRAAGWLAAAVTVGTLAGGCERQASVASPTTTLAPAVVVTEPPAPATTAPLPPLVDGVAFVGDSLGENLGRWLVAPGRRHGLQVFDDAISGCGVARSGAYRLAGARYPLSPVCAAWPDTWAERIRRDRPKIVAIQVGRHEVLDRVLEGRWTNILEPDHLYYVRAELELAIRVAGSDGARVVLLTSPGFSTGPWPENEPERVARFNALAVELAAAHGATLIDLGGRASPGGGYSAVVEGVALRAGGVHYSRAGVAWIGEWLLPQLRRLLGP